MADFSLQNKDANLISSVLYHVKYQVNMVRRHLKKSPYGLRNWYTHFHYYFTFCRQNYICIKNIWQIKLALVAVVWKSFFCLACFMQQ